MDGDKKADDLDMKDIYDAKGLKFRQKDDLVELLKLWIQVMGDTKTSRLDWDLSKNIYGFLFLKAYYFR